MMERFIAQIGWLILVYIIGSVPFGLLVARMGKGIDPRLSGSRNTGATNVARTCGTRFGVLTFALDMLKGLLPVLFAMGISTSPVFLSLTALAALIGHMYSVFLNRKGGKGVATTIGIFAALTPAPLFWALVLCLILIWTTGYISLGSLTLAGSLPVFIIVFLDWPYLVLSLLVMLLIYGKHRENIVRLARGEEKTWRSSPAETEHA
jgi:glycerol-3-phosphate acyltransferase PlsY